MSARPTEEELEDPAEMGRCGCLIPDGEVTEDAEAEDD